MKKIAVKSKMQKIIILILIVLLSNFIVPTYSSASFGGVLMGPIIDFIAGIGDAVLSALQFFMYDGNVTVGNTVGGAVSGALTIVNPFDSFLLMRSSDKFEETLKKYDMDTTEEGEIEISADEFDKGWLGWLPGSFADKDYGVPIIKYTPEKIFANQVPALDVNFINPKDWTDQATNEDNAEAMNEKSITRQLHSTIANWYIALRNLAIVALLSVLLYVGIRILISSTAGDKAKYKQMLMNWIVALCIVFFLHYVMSFILTVTEMITVGVSSGTEIVVDVQDSDNGNFKFKTDLTGLCRFQIQYKDLGARMIYLIFYIALVIYTVMFTWTYVKRAITMAFLTLIAPVVAITYPIDKIGDGQAQAFGIWLKEFIFNALLQPFHLIIYTIFLGAASEIAVQNPIYAILFLAFIIPSEKLLRKMFGFNKADTAGGMSTAAGVFGGAAAFNMVKSIVGKGAQRGSSGKAPATNNKIRAKNNIEDSRTPKGYSAFATTGGSALPSEGQGEDGMDYERANEFRRLQEEGLSQQEAMDRLNATMPADRGEIDYERANEFKRLQEEGLNQQEAMDRLNATMPQDRSRPDYERANEFRRLQKEEGLSQQEAMDRLNATTVRNDSSTEANKIRFASQDSQSDNIRQESNSTSGNTQNNTRTPSDLSKGKRVLNGMKSLGHATFNKQNAGKAARFVGRAAVRTATTGVGLAVGTAAGIAGGDLEDVLKYTAAGAALGNRTLGNATLNAMSGARKIGGNVAQTFMEGYSGLNEATMRRQAKEFVKDVDNREYFAREMAEDDGTRLSGKALNNVMENAAYYNNAGIDDNSKIKKSIKLEKDIIEDLSNTDLSEEEKRTMAREQATTISKIADKVDDKKLMTDEKYAQGLQNNFKRGLKAANSEMSERELNTQSEQMMKLLKKYKKAY